MSKTKTTLSDIVSQFVDNYDRKDVIMSTTNTTKPYCILSVDFDFFPDVTRQHLQYYPAPIDLPSEVTLFTWAEPYAIPSKKHKIKDIQINDVLFENMMDILYNQNPNIPILIANSHVHAYDFALANKPKNKPIRLVNVDFHADISNDNQELDCGNWLGHLKKDLGDDLKITWITRQSAIDIFGIRDILMPNIRTNFDEIYDMQFDAVFLCRSDSWTPPHLDIHFHKMKQMLCENFNDVRGSDDILHPRDMSTVSDIVTQTTQFFMRNVAAGKTYE